MVTAITTVHTAARVAAGQAANEYAAGGSFADYTGRRAENTLRAQRADLALWADYLCVATGGGDCPAAEALQSDPGTWCGITWGLVAGFVRWMLAAGYAVGSVNRRLATVRKYCALAAQAGAIPPAEAVLIRTVQGYTGQDARRVDERRPTTRKGAKKGKPVPLTYEQAAALRAQPDTPQGRRDAVIMALLLDHGLRVGELALLRVEDMDVQAGTFVVYRPKVGKVQTHRLTANALAAVAAYLAADAPSTGALLLGSRRGGVLAGTMSTRSIMERVATLGRAVGVVGLSPHDCRHYWATRAAGMGTDPFALRDAGGWSSLAMPTRYVAAAAVANERVRL